MAIFIFLIVIAVLLTTFLNFVCGIELETSRWIALALVFVGFIAFICWLMFSHEAKVIARAQNIAEIRKRRFAEAITSYTDYDDDEDDESDDYKYEWEDYDYEYDDEEYDDEEDDDAEKRRRQQQNDAAVSGAAAYWMATHGL